MKSKSKIFTNKLIALFLAIIMAISCFTGTMTAFAKSTDDYHDNNLASNFMAWAETTDNQTAEALLDYADLHLEDIMLGLMGTTHISFSQNIVIDTIKIDAYLDSVDGVLDLVRQASSLLNKYGTFVGGDVKNLDLSPLGLNYSTNVGVVSKCGKSFRSQNDAKTIIMAIAKTLYKNSNDFDGKNLLNQFFLGSFDVGSIIQGVLGGTVYAKLQAPLNMWDGYESNLVYNIVANLIWSNTNWYTDEEVAKFKSNLSSWNFDNELFGKLSSELMQKINILITYSDVSGQDAINSKTRLEEIKAKMKDGSTYEQAASALGYDPNIKYSQEPGTEGNVYLFQYGNDKISINKTDTLYNIGFKALKFAWNTAIKPTVGLVHVNYDVNYGDGGNFDNQFFYWMSNEGKWNSSNWKSNYSSDNVQAWANAVYADYDAKDSATFLKNVRKTFEYDRRAVSSDKAKNNWRDIDSTWLFSKLRYNPMADLYFNMQTGPINLYFEQTGTPNLDAFFDTVFTKYSSIVAGVNDALVAAVKDIFPDSQNIGLGNGKNVVTTNLTVPQMAITGNVTTPSTIANALVSNALKMLEYAGNSADENILGGFYKKNSMTYNGSKTNLTEKNLEEAMVPLLISCIQNVTATNDILDTDWDMCQDAEGVAYVALSEYLAFVQPSRDYSQLISIKDGKICAGTVDISGDGKYTLLEDTIFPMCRDAVGYLLSSIVPVRTKDGNEWNIEKTTVTGDKSTIFDLLNSVICYYGSQDNFKDGTTGKCVASLLGCVNTDGSCKLTMSNSIWTNIDLVANKLMPVLGTIQYGNRSYAGKVNSYELIYKNFIEGIMEVGANNGVTNIITKIFTMCNAPVFSTDGIDIMIYDSLLAPFVNGLFGARYSGQGYTNVIPYSSYYGTDKYSDTNSATPFDSLLQKNTICYYSVANGKDDGKNTGMLGILICNIYQAFGGSSYDSKASKGASGAWNGGMFLVKAVNNFIPSFVPELSEQKFAMASAKVEDASQTGLKVLKPINDTKLDITNNSIGLNRFYRDSTGKVQQDPRYFIDVTSVIVYKGGTDVPASKITLGNAKGVVAPEETMKVTISGQAEKGSNIYEVRVNYDVFTGKKQGSSNPTKSTSNTLYSGLTTSAYISTSTESSWENTLYSATANDMRSYGGSYAVDAGKSTAYTLSTSAGGASNSLFATVPKDFIVTSSDPASVENLGLRIKSTSAEASVDGFYTYAQAHTEYYPVTNGSLSDTSTTLGSKNTSMAYAVVDSATGDVLNYDLYDYSTDGGVTFNRGNANSIKGKQGYTAAEIQAMDTSASGFATRSHVVWTKDEAIASGYVKGYAKDGDKYTAAFVTPNSTMLQGATTNSSKDSITFGTPTPGMYLVSKKTTVAAKGETYVKWIAYDGKTKLNGANYSMPIHFYTSTNNNMEKEVSMHIVDDSANTVLYNKYNEDLKKMSGYRLNDFTELSEEAYGVVNPYEGLSNAFSKSLQAISSPLTVEAAASYSSTYVTRAATYSTTRAIGDKAYTPIPTSVTLSDSMAALAFAKDGYWYTDEAGTMPIYSKTQLAESAVTPTGTVFIGSDEDGRNYETGKDNLGKAVIKGTDGAWYDYNAKEYEEYWDTTTYTAPYKTVNKKQAVDADDNKLYRQGHFSHKTKDNKSVSSDEAWDYKYSKTEEIIKPNDGTDYRGLQQRRLDELEFWMEECHLHLVSDAGSRIKTEITDVRQDQNSINYNVASYERMVMIAKEGEKLASWTKVVDEDGEPVLDKDGNPTYDYTTNGSSIEIDEAVRIFKLFNGRVIKRNYVGDKVNAEIKRASSYEYTDLKQTSTTTMEPTVDADGEVGEDVEVKHYTVSKSANATAPFGAYDENGVLQNKGTKVYSDENWQNYVDALGNAIEIAQAKNAELVDTYSAKSRLVRAENGLMNEPELEDIMISGKVLVANDKNGISHSSGIGDIDVVVNGEVVATSAEDGSFTAVVPIGTKELTFKGKTTIDRTVKLSGENNITGAEIPIIICDYNKDNLITSSDGSSFNKSITGDYNVTCDLNCDSIISSADKSVLAKMINAKIEYTDITLD